MADFDVAAAVAGNFIFQLLTFVLLLIVLVISQISPLLIVLAILYIAQNLIGRLK